MDSKEKSSTNASTPGEGVRSIRTTNVFRIINFELYAKPNMLIMGVGAACFAGVLGYIAYMRSKYEGMGYYAAVQDGGEQVFIKKESNWDK